MSKTLISVVVLAVVIVGGYFIITKNKGEYTAPTVNTETITETTTTTTTNGLPAQTGKKMAFSEFVKQGGTYKCDVKQAMSDFESTGVVYIDGKKISGNFFTTAEGRSVITDFITRDGYYYTWSSDASSSALPTTGFKMKVSTEDNTSGNYSWNAEQIGDYNCEAWTADESVFTPPTQIKFQTVTS